MLSVKVVHSPRISRTTKLKHQPLTKSQIKNADRPKLLDELRRHAWPEWYQRLLAVPTPYLRTLLRLYERK